MTSRRDALGQRGEALATVALTQFHAGEAIFKLAFLGEKWEAVDFLVESNSAPNGCRDFFFVQVRTTADLPDANGRVGLTVKREDLEALAAYPAPRYLLIVTERDGYVYIRPVEAGGPGFSRFRCEHALTVKNSLALRDDVRRDWEQRPAIRWTSCFSNPTGEP